MSHETAADIAVVLLLLAAVVLVFVCGLKAG